MPVLLVEKLEIVGCKRCEVQHVKHVYMTRSSSLSILYTPFCKWLYFFLSFQLLVPVVVGVGAIVVTIILVKMFSNKKPKGPPKTLINSDTKIPLVLVDREVQ